jgi:hypothetical protein
MGEVYIAADRRLKRRRFFVLSLLLLVLPAPAFSQHRFLAQQSPPNIVFILVDDLRWDELSIAGHPYIRTPNIDRIGKSAPSFVMLS